MSSLIFMHILEQMNKLDLDEHYKLLNEEIFSNQLPEKLPIKWNHSKTSMGKTRIKMTHLGAHEMSISISKFFICSEKEYVETLIHEMIHVFMVILGEFRKDNRVHGPLFRKHMDHINKNFPHYRISIKEKKRLPIDISKMKIRDGFFLISQGKQYFNIYYESIDEKMKNKIIRALKRSFNITDGTIYFFTGRYEELATAPVRRSMRTLTGKIQYLRDVKSMESLFDKIQKNSPDAHPIN